MLCQLAHPEVYPPGNSIATKRHWSKKSSKEIFLELGMLGRSLDFLYLLSAKTAIYANLSWICCPILITNTLSQKPSLGCHQPSAIKDFWLNSPGNIFSSDFDDNWVCGMDQGNEGEKMSTTQRHQCCFPKIIIGGIKQYLTQTRKRIYRKASPACTFLIENCCWIFAEKNKTKQNMSVSGKVSLRPPERISWCYFQGTDAFYDSLEHEPDGHVDALCRNEVKKHRR
ncbi:hypothetical protein A6R68_08125 [Neotoma lepida]|uniref:Uncharacterized protein n=1 Tax=Neotoma lepida TaxID=56216 RepID=A0A1A6G4N6_NEOLE|nr:hypothetical protein A6R68_08125 [Neotoma lepida]